MSTPDKRHITMVGVPEGSQKGPKRPKTAFLGHKQVWWLQTDRTVWNKSGTSQGTSLVLHWKSFGVREGHVGVPEGSQKGPKRPKTAFLGHKQIWWLQTDGTVWNKGGSSQGTSPVMHWNSFAGQGGPSRGTRGLPKGSKTAFFGHKRIWSPQKGPPDPGP